jgi:CMP-N-acetylneuraminic acid synthetase
MLNSKKIVALLPMKANSERVKGKNFKNFNGKPLFKWILDTLLAIELIDLIVINTDAKDILEQNGLIKNDRIIIRDRKKELCGDMVSMNLVIADDLENIDADLYLMTHTTNPFLSSNTIFKALNILEIAQSNNTADSLFTVTKTQTRFYRSDGSSVNHDPKNLVRTQDLEAWYEENSNLYIFSKNVFKSTNARIGLKPILYETNKFESIDIDNQEDWDFAIIASNFLKTDN